MRIPAPKGASPRVTALWLGWIAAFFAIEIPAIARKRPQDTLSDHVWSWFGIPQHKAPAAGIRARRFALLAFMAWLCSHFLTGDDV